ncbi:MAG: hypothetical protein WBW76_12255 [Candidatus Cybelea sp.]
MIAASRRFPVLALDHIEGKGGENELELLNSLLTDPDFTQTVDDIVIECGNSRYQAILDRYVAGGQVSEQQVRVVWRKTTQIFGCEADPTWKTLINVVRNGNRRAPAHSQRVLAADPPIDWSAVHTSDQFEAFLSLRDESAATVIRTQVLAKHRRALVVMGGGHLTKHPPAAANATLTTLLERENPGSTCVIYAISDASRFDGQVRRTLATWPAPVIASIAGTDVGAESGYAITSADTMRRVGSRWVPVDNAYPGYRVERLVDAILYLGPTARLRAVPLREPTDEPYATELRRIRAIAEGNPHPNYHL